MTIDEAIRILTLMGTPDFDGHTEDIIAARKLGIEALRRITSMRWTDFYSPRESLLGETKE